jgi:hypothetical protein
MYEVIKKDRKPKKSFKILKDNQNPHIEEGQTT